MSRTTSLFPQGTRDRRSTTAITVSQCPNYGLLALPMWLIGAWEACRRFCRASNIFTSARRFRSPEKLS